VSNYKGRQIQKIILNVERKNEKGILR